ncbi:tyrosine-type recombinase/integrase [Hyphomonas adhaerens]|uniref:tyrosine-type recombinase/integrase n=1 Tax=Hyphomonas adhaerens TaxID=81029 RepID=UPI002355C2AD|nr:integrase family protein [Hyphomonas adhaerens]
MVKLRLTDTWLSAVTDAGDYSDTIESCLKVRVARTGAKTFSAVRKLGGKTVRVRIGAYPEIGLREARTRAGEFREMRALAPTPAARAEEVADAVSASASIFFHDYVADMQARGVTSYGRVKGTLIDGKYALLPFLVARHGCMPRAGDVTIQDLQAWMAESYARSPNYAPHLRSYIVTAWKWAVKNRYDYRGGARDYGITYNIAEQLPTTPRNKPGDRFLSNDELKALWHALDENHPTHRVLKLMIAMGGLRVTEVTMSLAANWRDGWLHLPETKNGKSHQLPITRTAAPLVARCLELAHPRSPYLLSNPRDPDEPLTMAAISRGAKRLNKQLKFPDWNPRDLRRTMKTHLIDAGVDERWLDIWHNHGQTASVARKHYIRAEYADLKRDVAEAIDGWLGPVLLEDHRI